jgi:putative membrane protein
MKDNRPNLVLAKKLNLAAWIVTAAVLVLVALMREVKIPLPENLDFSFLPPFYSALNALTAVALIVALVFIKQKKVEWHRKTIYFALACSLLFLLAYVVYHFTTPATIFGDSNHDGVLAPAEDIAVSGIRPWYILLLVSHISLAALSLPFILFTFIRAYTNQFDKHKMMARWVYPVWLYVAITGPICYLMLMPYY